MFVDQIADDPCIPFHNLLLKDLCLVENTPKFYDDGKVNFEIFSLLASVYQRLQDFRGFLYELKKNKNIQLFLQNKVSISHFLYFFVF